MYALNSFRILPQPDESSCGPTCLHALYRFYGMEMELERLVREVDQLENGGTLGALLASHALDRGCSATIYTYNLDLFDPTWFGRESPFIADKLRAQLNFKNESRLREATGAYLRFLEKGGDLKFEVLRPKLIRRYLQLGIPVMTGLSATFLYGSRREYGPAMEYDDIRGVPSGHFVVLHGYERRRQSVWVADPLRDNPLGGAHSYEVGMDRLINAILLGVVTYDGNLVVITPGGEGGEG